MAVGRFNVVIGVRTATLLGLTLAVVFAAFAALPGRSLAAGPCGPPVTSVIACENQQPGDPQSDWFVNGSGDDTIQGYATQMSVNVGQTITFKIDTPSTNYHIDILRLGYYQGDGARKIVSAMKPTAKLPQTQPACSTFSATGLIDCGNWSASASWAVPSTAVSGVYIAHLVRDDAQDPGGDSLIPFVVRNDASHSAILLQTSDETWQAYNTYGGNSLYQCTVACPPGSPNAYKGADAVSYNRPFHTCDDDEGRSCLFYAEWPMIMWLEQNGYDVSYTSEADVASSASTLLNHKSFISSGHDEYWSASQRANVTAARNAGVNLAFFSGNEVFWKTRWGADPAGNANRVVTTYKETHYDTIPVDPQDPPTWTGSWMDPRFSPPSDGGNPQNALTGQLFNVNFGTSDIKVPSTYSKLRLWRNTPVATLAAGQSRTLAPGVGTLGYEWDVDADDGFRPAGEFDLSSTTVSGLQVFTDYGTTVNDNGTATHHLSLYRAPSGALVFGAGTVQWAWGLSNENPSEANPDPVMEQATVNLFADMGAQPATLVTGLTAATQSTDTTAPKSTITAPGAGSSMADGAQTTITGTATDTGGGVVSGMEVSTDGGTTWHPATISGSDATTVNWSYPWVADISPSTTIESRATDDSGNIEKPSDAITLNIGCPCSMFGATTPTGVSDLADSGDPTPVEVGVKFTTDKFGTVSGIRFYKATTNTGTHIGSLWTSSGQRLASATFTSESASGWQTVSFASPVQISPGQTYVASYYAPNGHYSATAGYFYPQPSPPPTGGGNVDAPPLHMLHNINGTLDGMYSYSNASTFPLNSFGAANYWVDVNFTPAAVPGSVTNVQAAAGYQSARLTWSAPSTGGVVTTYTVTPYINGTAQTPTTVTGTPPVTNLTLSSLNPLLNYTFTVQASNPNGAGPVSAQSNAVSPSATPTAPGPPTNLLAQPATTSAQVAWAPPVDNGGGSITGYKVTSYIGSTPQTTVQVDGSTTSTVMSNLSDANQYTFTVDATNSAGTSVESSPSAAVQPQDTILDFASPVQADSGDGSSVELGVKFTSDLNGSITGLRFYKASTNTGTHSGNLWTSTGAVLASATFTNETASGWQTALFSKPVSITAGTTYVASYFAPFGHYSYSPNAFNSAIDNPPLHGISNGTSANGVYAYGLQSAFPTNTFNATNYSVDVLFLGQAPGQATGVSAKASDQSARVSWTAPSGGTAPQSYTITPYIGSQAQTPTVIKGSPPATSTTITGLTGGTAYTFTVTASNRYGTGSESAHSAAVTPLASATSPSAPTNVTAQPASSQAQVNWTAPTDNGGSTITTYTVTPFIGAQAQTPTTVSAPATSATVTSLTNGTGYTFKVTANNSAGAGDVSSASGAVTPDNTIFDFSAPLLADAGDGSSVVLGTAFTTDRNGLVTGVRFYKSSANTGTHVGSLWSSTGTLLASATFTNETASGWQDAYFSTPVSITTGTTYVVSYLAPSGHYAATGGAFSSAVDNPPLHAVANTATSPNGVYAYGATNAFPSNSFNSTNYWVDPIFQ
jgi:hypothetical protein